MNPAGAKQGRRHVLAAHNALFPRASDALAPELPAQSPANTFFLGAASDNMLFWFLAVPVAIMVRAFTTEEVFRQPREYCVRQHRHYAELAAEEPRRLWQRVRCVFLSKLSYLPTCDFCFSFWGSLLIVWIGDYSIHYADWRGFALATFVVMGVANVYLSAFSHIRVDLRKERAVAETIEKVKP